jgi:F-type H+-transporting ATPase subunit gamma
MATLLDIRRRIRSVKSTQQLTRAMKMVAAARLRRAQDSIFNARPYANQMLTLLASLAAPIRCSPSGLSRRSCWCSSRRTEAFAGRSTPT